MLGPQSGNVINKDGEVVNIVDLLGGTEPISDEVVDVNMLSPRSGLVIGSDGKVYDLVKLLQNTGGGNGSGSGTPKDYLMVMLTQHIDIVKGDVVPFDRITFGTIPYNASAGSVTLQAGKAYKITLDIAAMGNGWSVFGMLDASTTSETPEEGFYPLLIQGTVNPAAVSANSRSFIFIPDSTRDFHIVLTSATDDVGEYQVRAVNSSLTIVEI